MTAPAAALDFTRHWAGYAGLAVFALAYLAVMSEEKLHIRKSKPVILAAGIIWALIAVAYLGAGDQTTAAEAVRHNLAEYGELFLFILVAMTFVNTMEERQLFDRLRCWLARRRMSLRAVFWATGGIAFFLSSLLDNLTTALVMGTVAITVGRGNRRFIALACISVVVAANAGGAFSPFGDITSLMVWQSGHAQFWDFFRLFVPSAVNWLIPALIMSFAVPNERPEAGEDEDVELRRGAWGVVGLFALTIAMAVSAYNLLKLPPVLGMTTGLALLKLYGWHLQRTLPRRVPAPVLAPAGAPVAAPAAELARTPRPEPALAGAGAGAYDEADELAFDSGFSLDNEPGEFSVAAGPEPPRPSPAPPARPAADGFDIFEILRKAEWDTLMFFYGIIMCVGGLAQLGYLRRLSAVMYDGAGATAANVGVGLISSVVDNIPVMFAVLRMNPEMGLSQWLLVTLTAGVGGSLLSIGSAAGVALMGQARGAYTFGSHLKWTWAIALGYAASIYVHLLINGR
jgi:Na+/H+ antiporter NhaD/arsenite permease-like protein